MQASFVLIIIFAKILILQFFLLHWMVTPNFPPTA